MDRRQTRQGSQHPRNATVEFPGFFLPHISQTCCWRSQGPRNADEHRPKKKKKKSQEKPAFSSQRTRKRAASHDRKLSDNNSFTPAKHHRKILLPSCSSHQQCQKLDFCPHHTVRRCSTLTFFLSVSEKPEREAGTPGSPPTGDNKTSCSPCWGFRRVPVLRQNFYHHPGSGGRASGEIT